jgi:hypothetical protein
VIVRDEVRALLRISPDRKDGSYKPQQDCDGG